jgi:uncharacterized membrane protein
MTRMSDKVLENLIGNLLRAGVLIAAALVVIGGVMYLAGEHAEVVHYSVFQPVSAELRSTASIVAGAFRLNAPAVMQLGVVLLIITPIARVALAMVGFWLEHDRLYAVVSAIVLAILFVSLMWAK